MHSTIRIEVFVGYLQLHLHTTSSTPRTVHYRQHYVTRKRLPVQYYYSVGLIASGIESGALLLHCSTHSSAFKLHSKHIGAVQWPSPSSALPFIACTKMFF